MRASAAAAFVGAAATAFAGASFWIDVKEVFAFVIAAGVADEEGAAEEVCDLRVSRLAARARFFFRHGFSNVRLFLGFVVKRVKAYIIYIEYTQKRNLYKMCERMGNMPIYRRGENESIQPTSLDSKIQLTPIDRRLFPDNPFFADVLEAYGRLPKRMVWYKFLPNCPQNEVADYIPDVLNNGMGVVVKPAAQNPEQRDLYMILKKMKGQTSKSI